MIVDNWLKQATNTLKRAGIGTARLDCLVLLEDEIGRNRAWILAHPEDLILAESLKKLNKKLARRVAHEPIAYIRGFSEFYGRKFKVNKHVLEPRPESETMIEMLKHLVASQQSPVVSKLQIIDVGTGSGALGITAKLEIPEVEVIASDIDPNCLKVARQNAQALGVTIEFFEGDLLQPLSANGYQLTAILANLPYVPANFYVNQAAAMEPKIAIRGGSDGLDVYRRFFDQLKALKWRPLFILTESLPPQHSNLAQIAKAAGYKLSNYQDFIQVFEKG